MPAILTELSKSSFSRLKLRKIQPADAVWYGLVLRGSEYQEETREGADFFFRMEVDSLLWEILKIESCSSDLSIGKLSGLLIERFLDLSKKDILCRIALHRKA